MQLSDKWQALLRPRLQKLLSASFYPVWTGIRAANQQMSCSTAAADAWRYCCDLCSETCPNSAYHAHCTSSYVTQLYKTFLEKQESRGDSSWCDMMVALGKARRCHMICYGSEIWQLQVAQLQWPSYFGHVGSISDLRNADASCRSDTCWLHTESNCDSTLLHNITIPMDLEIKAIDIRVHAHHVLLGLNMLDGPTKIVLLGLPAAVDLTSLSPVRFRRRERKLSFELHIA